MSCFARRTVLSILAASVMACSDSTGPDTAEPTYEVALQMVEREGPVVIPFAGLQEVECAYRISALGAGNAPVAWGRAEFRLFTGVERSVPAHVIPAPVLDVTGGFGGDHLAAGETRFITVILTAEIPFSADLVFFYRGSPELPEQSATVPVSCEFPAPPGTPPPTIQSIDAVLPATVTPGTTLAVTIPVQGAIRMWELRIAFTGACVAEAVLTLGELESTSFTFQLLVPVPTSCAPGGPVRLRASVMDVLGRVTTLEDDVTFSISAP